MKPSTKKSDLYDLSLAGHGVNIKKTVSENVALQIATLVMSGSTAISAEVSKPSFSGEQNAPAGMSPKTFMASKRPASDIERITCLAYYQTHYRTAQSYKTIDLTKLNTEASQPAFSNTSVAARNAVVQKYLAPAGGGKKLITSIGEAVVDALPDRDKVKSALEANRVGRKKYKSRQSKRIKQK